MNQHLSQADLVSFALLPDEAPDARLHLASCAACSTRMDAIRDELALHRQDHRESVESRDATFWKRQEIGIMRRVSRTSRFEAPRRSLAAGLLLTVALGGFWFGRTSVDRDVQPATPVAQASTAPSSVDQGVVVPSTEISTDPWEAESLNEFQAVVDWESWVDEDGKEQGTI